MKTRSHLFQISLSKISISPFLSFLLLCLCSTPIYAKSPPALNWNDLELQSNYQLNQTIWFQPDLKLSQSHPLQFVDLQADLEQVFFLVFKNLNCGDEKLKSNLILINPEPEDTAHDKSIGVQILENCYVGIYLEPIYYYNKSLFLNKDNKIRQRFFRNF